MVNRGRAENRGILYGTILFLAFLILLALILGGIFLFQTKGGFYSAFKGELHRGFLISAFLLLIFSSILYTPFSYGISHYFLLAQKGAGRFSSLFFLFRDPLQLLKAVAISLLKKILIYLEGLAVLLVAAMVEVALFFLFLLFSGEDLFSVRENPFLLAAEFMLRSPALILLSVLLWVGVLIGFLLIRLRFILCKYVVLCFPAVSPRQAIQIGKNAIRGHLWSTVFFYLRYAAIMLLSVFSFGTIVPLGESAAKRSFSAYAAGLAEAGFREYCRKRSFRNY